MGLTELLEQQGLKSISQQTMISEENIERIVAEEYKGLTKAKALGFLSILEREYQLDLKDVRNNAIAYFGMHDPEGDTVNIALPRVEEKEGHSKWFVLILLGLLGYAAWYFFTQYDKKTIHTPTALGAESNASQKETKKSDSIFSVAINENTINDSKSETKKAAKIATDSNHTEVTSSNATIEKKDIATDANSSTAEKNSTASQDPKSDENSTEKSKTAELTKVILRPAKRLWFGLINMRTGKRDHFSIRKPYSIDLSKGDWLVATSPASFSLVFNDETQKYNHGKEEHFLITKEGVTALKKNAYINKGGYRKW